MPTPNESSFHCSIERHLFKLKNPAAAFIYLFAARLSNGSGRFNPSINSLAEYFGAANSTIIRGLTVLVRAGLLVEIGRKVGSPVVYKVVPHDEWAEAHPGDCVTKSMRPGSSVHASSSVHATTNRDPSLGSDSVHAIR